MMMMMMMMSIIEFLSSTIILLLLLFQISFRQMGIFLLSFFGFNCWWLDLHIPHHIPEVVFIRKTLYFEISH